MQTLVNSKTAFFPFIFHFSISRFILWNEKPAFCRPFLCKLTVLLLQKGVLYSIFMVYIVFRHNTDCGLLSERVEKDGISRIFRRSFRHQRVHRHGRMSAFGGTAAARRRGAADRRGQRGRRARAGGGEVLRVRLAGVAPDGQPRPGPPEPPASATAEDE